MPDIGHYEVIGVESASVIAGYRRIVQFIVHLPEAGALISPLMKIHG